MEKKLNQLEIWERAAGGTRKIKSPKSAKKKTNTSKSQGTFLS